MSPSPLFRLSFFLAAALCACAASAQSVATFRVTFDMTWSPATHPEGFPAGAHFSPIVGVTHDASVSLWAPGAPASAGIEAMAERGVTSGLVAEASALRAAGYASEPVVGSGQWASPGSASVTFTVVDSATRLSVVSMLAPSPDWFVGVHGLDLRPGGRWASVDVPLFAYDSGTDSGPAYTSPDADTQPREPVARLTGTPFVVGGATPTVGTLRVELLTVAAGENEADEAAFALSPPAPNPTRSASTLTLALDRSQAVTVRVVDALGRTVAVLADGAQPAGPLRLRLDVGTLPAGVYTVVARGEGTVATRRLVVAR